jgi:hypothetical protein
MRTSRLTRIDQKFLSFDLSMRWNCMPGLDGSSWRSKAVVFAAFCSSPVSLARLEVKVSAMRNSIRGRPLGACSPNNGVRRLSNW